MSDSEGPLLDAEDRLCDILQGEGIYFEEHKQSKVIQSPDTSLEEFRGESVKVLLGSMS